MKDHDDASYDHEAMWGKLEMPAIAAAARYGSVEAKPKTCPELPIPPRDPKEPRT